MVVVLSRAAAITPRVPLVTVTGEEIVQTHLYWTLAVRRLPGLGRRGRKRPHAGLLADPPDARRRSPQRTALAGVACAAALAADSC